MGFYLLSYLCMIVFLLATAYLVYRQITLPVHVRWEIYPVQHETAARAAYGGSYLEEINWWEKKREQGPCSMRSPTCSRRSCSSGGCGRKTGSLWRVSFPFHFGSVSDDRHLRSAACSCPCRPGERLPCRLGRTIKSLLDGLIVLTGWTGLILGTVGSLGLLYKRLDRSGTQQLFVFCRLFQSPVHLSFFPIRPRLRRAADPLWRARRPTSSAC